MFFEWFNEKISRTLELLILASLHIICVVAFAAFQEKCFEVPDFKSRKHLLTVITPTVYFICGIFDRCMKGDLQQKISTIKYVQLSVLVFLGMYTTNASLS